MALRPFGHTGEKFQEAGRPVGTRRRFWRYTRPKPDPKPVVVPPAKSTHRASYVPPPGSIALALLGHRFIR